MKIESMKEKLDVYEMYLGQLNGEQNFQYEQTRNQFERLMAQIYQLDENGSQSWICLNL